MSAICDGRTSRAFAVLTVLLALAWSASVAAPAPANGPAAHVTAATSSNLRVAMVRQQQIFSGLVAHRRDKSDRHRSILLSMQTGPQETALLLSAGSGSPAAARPRRRTRPAPVDARAPPLLEHI